MNGRATEMRQDAEERAADWLAHGWAIGVFENKDLGSRNVGARFALPFAPEQLANAKVGEARAPDSAHGLGWRYILVAKPTTVADTINAVFTNERD
ncbi:MAG TPA: hypothetical protein PKV98_04455 [Burkholderiaceae bacterium]|nr:hypothetical protein [Burkholderiaceae bacterium]